MRTPPPDLPTERVRRALADGWRIHAESMHYVPEGGGSHHWRVLDQDGRPCFVTVDDLDNKDWLGETPGSVCEGLRRALNTAIALRRAAGLEFVVAPIATGDVEPLRRLDRRYTVSVFPFLVGRSHAFSPYTDPSLREQALDMIASLHRATAAVREVAPGHEPRYGGQRDLAAFLADPNQPWSSGPFSEPARSLLAGHVADLTQLVTGFDHLVDTTASVRVDTVITHGEPHPANLMSVDGRLVLIDWDTAALAPPERDLSLVAATSGGGIERYEDATGRRINVDVMTLYRLRWYLDDLASAVRLFRMPHRDTPDTRRWSEGLPPRLKQLPRWLALLD